MPSPNSQSPTDLAYTGQRALDEGMGGLMDYRARFYSPSLNRFLQPDTIIPDQTNPQAWNRYAYTINNPLRYSDPTGHKMCEDMDCNNDGDDDDTQTPTTPTQTPTTTPTRTPTVTPTQTPTNTPTLTPTSTPTLTTTPLPTPTGYPNSIRIAIAQMTILSPDLGKTSYDLLKAEGYTITYNGRNFGYVDPNTKTIYVPPGASPAYIAGTIAHEATHVSMHADDTLWEEYHAFFVGDVVRQEIIDAGPQFGSPSEMRHPLTDYTVNTNNPNTGQLSNDLITWFNNYEPKYHSYQSAGGYGILPALPSWH